MSYSGRGVMTYRSRAPLTASSRPASIRPGSSVHADGLIERPDVVCIASCMPDLVCIASHRPDVVCIADVVCIGQMWYA